MEELTYNELYEQLKEKVSFYFACYTDKDIDNITKFLIHQGIEDVSGKNIKKIVDYHIESSKERMFNWLHMGEDESPFDIKNAPYVEDMGNVLVLEDGTCLYWYNVGKDKEPYVPYEVEEDYGL